MKGKVLVFLTVGVLLAVHPAEAKTPLTLMEAYRLALVRSETVAVSAQEIERAQARFYQSLDVMLPTVYFQMTRFERDVGKDGGSSGDGVSGDSRRRTTPEHKFVFSQPLFSGFKEFAALTAGGADKKQQKFAYQRAKELLVIDVAESFYTLLETRRDAHILGDLKRLLSERIKELEERVGIGRSRESELKAAVADLKLIEADLVSAESLEEIARNLLEFYVGEVLGGRELDDADPVVEVGEFAGHLSKARARADVQAAEQAYHVARSGVVSAQSGLFPSLTLDGNYYAERVGFQSGNDWDVLLTLKVPLFDGGQTFGDIKDAVSVRETSKLEWQETVRKAEREARDAYETLRASRLIEKALSEAYEASKENHEILTKEYRLNLVNNLDVLDALRRFQEVHQRYNRARYQLKKDYWRFKTAVGEVPV